MYHTLRLRQQKIHATLVSVTVAYADFTPTKRLETLSNSVRPDPCMGFNRHCCLEKHRPLAPPTGADWSIEEPSSAGVARSRVSLWAERDASTDDSILHPIATENKTTPCFQCAQTSQESSIIKRILQTRRVIGESIGREYGRAF